MVSENGEDERGARPVNNAPDRLAIARQNRDGSPEYHGWPDRFGFLDSTQAVFNPIGGPGDDLFPDIARIKAENTPARLGARQGSCRLIYAANGCISSDFE